jgi:hypothetical protein
MCPSVSGAIQEPQNQARSADLPRSRSHEDAGHRDHPGHDCEDGSVKDARVLKSVPLLDQPRSRPIPWKFTPTLLNNVPVEVLMTVTVNFTLGGGQHEFRPQPSASRRRWRDWRGQAVSRIEVLARPRD